MNLIFCLKINVKGFCKLLLSFKVFVAKYAQITQNNKFAISLQYLKKELINEVDFFHADKHQSFLKLISTLWPSKFPTSLILSLLMDMIKYFQITQSKKFSICLQHLKKQVRNGGHFWHADKRQSFYKLVLSFLVEVARHVRNTQNRKLVIFLQYIKKKLSQLLCVLLWCNTFRYFTGVQSCSLLHVIMTISLRKLQTSVWYGRTAKIQILQVLQMLLHF